MENTTKIEKNQEYTIDITGMGYEGEGIGRINNFAVFVKGALTGEKVMVKITKVSKNFAFAHLLEVIEPSKYRLSPECGLNRGCGGCQFQHFAYEGQLEFKRRRVIDSVTRIGKLEGVIIHPVIGMENPYRYRNKVQLPVSREKGKVKIGFFAPRTHNVIDMESCLIQDEAGDKVIKIARNWITKYNISTYDEGTGEGIIRHIMVRKGFKTGEVMVVVVTRGRKLPFIKEFIDNLKKEIQGLKSVIQNINDKKTNVVLGSECITLWGEDKITDYIGEFKFNISPLSFFQVNPIQTEVLYGKALEYANLTGNEIVFDAYCGTGTISLFLSKKVKKVYGVEVVPQAIDNARENAEQNNIENAEFIVGESEKVIPELINKGIKADVVVVDPPRKGCDKDLLFAIAKMEPERIVYVSCDPGTLARDLKILDELNYKTLEIQPVDMFPQTFHVECVTLMSRVKE